MSLFEEACCLAASVVFAVGMLASNWLLLVHKRSVAGFQAEIWIGWGITLGSPLLALFMVCFWLFGDWTAGDLLMMLGMLLSATAFAFAYQVLLGSVLLVVTLNRMRRDGQKVPDIPIVRDRLLAHMSHWRWLYRRISAKYGTTVEELRNSVMDAGRARDAEPGRK